MKLIKYTVLTLFVIIPFLIINSVNARISIKVKQTEKLYTNIVNNATEDGVKALKDNTIVNIKYGKEKEITTDSYEVINTFLNSLYYGFEAIGQIDKVHLQGYIPIIIIVGYDGYYIYSAKEYTSYTGEKEIKHILSDKKYYTYKDTNNNIIKFTLDNYIEFLNTSSNELQAGAYNTIDKLDNTLINNFEQIRKNTIIKTLEEELELAVNIHNQYTKDLGIIFNFNIPITDSNIWGRTIEDVGLIVCFQGKKISSNKYLNIFNMKEAKVLKRQEYYGYEIDGKKYYCRKNCTELINKTIIKQFMSPLEATKEGYRPCKTCTP